MSLSRYKGSWYKMYIELERSRINLFYGMHVSERVKLGRDEFWVNSQPILPLASCSNNVDLHHDLRLHPWIAISLWLD